MSPTVDEFVVRPLSGGAEAARCAELMAGSEPWITLGRDYEASLRVVSDPGREVYVAMLGGQIAGFLILCMTGAFVGYLQTVCVTPEYQGRGLGTRLVGFAEDRIFREVPNVFMCVSSFNPRARDLYLRLGYKIVGELEDYLVPGYSEILLRKATGPIMSSKLRP